VRAAVAVAVALVLAAAGPALAMTPETAPATAPPVEPLMAGFPAPFDGVLVPEETLAGYLHLGVDLEECRLKVAARDRLLLAPPLLPAAPAPRWTFWTGGVVGFVLGVAGGGALMYAAFDLAGGR
jgi:hypothetical protein